MEYVMNGRQTERNGNRDRWMAPNNCFRCRGNDQWVTIACGSDEEWAALATVVGRPELGSDSKFRTAAERKRHEDELEELLTKWTTTRDKWEVTRVLQSSGVAAFPSMSSKDLIEDEHLLEREFFIQLHQPEVGARTMAGVPWRLTNSFKAIVSPAPCLGQDTDSIASEVLGYSPDRIAKLKEQRVFY